MNQLIEAHIVKPIGDQQRKRLFSFDEYIKLLEKEFDLSGT